MSRPLHDAVNFSAVIPANAGIHSFARRLWTPASAGVTKGKEAALEPGHDNTKEQAR